MRSIRSRTGPPKATKSALLEVIGAPVRLL
jgi:hypothetical protein